MADIASVWGLDDYANPASHEKLFMYAAKANNLDLLKKLYDAGCPRFNHGLRTCYCRCPGNETISYINKLWGPDPRYALSDAYFDALRSGNIKAFLPDMSSV